MSSTSGTNTGGYLSSTQAYGGGQSLLQFSGLSSGINTTQVINSLMSVAALPQQLLSSQLATVQQNINIYGALATDYTALQTASDALSTAGDWQAWQASSSSSAVSATAGAGAVGGSLSFSVNSVATASSLISVGAVASTSASVAAGNILLAQGGTAIGFATLGDNGQSLGLGAHTIKVTQASSGAVQSGTSPLASSTVITAGTNDTINYTLDGATHSLTIAPSGTTGYSASQLTAAIGTASGGTLSASIGNTGNLVLATAAEGSAHSLQITGGDGLAGLGLVAGAATTGTDGIVSVDGTSTTITDTTAGHTMNLTSGSGGTVAATFSGGLRVGSVAAQEVSTGTGSLSSVIGAINGAGLGFTAAAVQTGAGSYHLELLSSTTGTNSAINVDPNAFSGLGRMQTLSAGTNADLTVGQGAGQFDYQSQTNAVTGLMPGVTLNVSSTTPPGSPVTVSLTPDAAGMAAKVQNLVSVANTLLGDVNSTISFNSTTNASGPLMGDSIVTNLYDQVLGAISGSGGSSSGAAGNDGISMNQDGTMTFDAAAFESAYSANPTKVASGFIQGGSTSSSSMSFLDSSDTTAPGTYDVNVTHAATQATTTVDATAAHSFAFTSNGISASYASGGQGASAVAAGLNDLFSSKGLGLSATVQGTSVQIATLAYGSSATLQLQTDGGATQSSAGTDVAGTINGQVGLGTGQILGGTPNTGTQGLLVQIAGSATGDLGTVTYSPGLAQSLAYTANTAVDPVVGALTEGVRTGQNEVRDLKAQIANWNPILAAKQIALQLEWTNMEASLAGLKSTSQALGFTSSSSSSSSSSSGG